MTILEELLSNLPWFQKILALADTLPPDMPAPWNDKPLPDDIILGVVPHFIRKLYIADSMLQNKVIEEIIDHHESHIGCSPACPSMQEFENLFYERTLLLDITQFIIQRDIEKTSNYRGIGKILSDWRIASALEINREIGKDAKDADEEFSLQDIPPPSDEEKKKYGA